MLGAGLGNQQQQQHTEALRAPVVSARSAWIARSVRRCDVLHAIQSTYVRALGHVSFDTPPFGGHVRYAPAMRRRVGENGPGEFGAWVLVT